MTKLLFVCMTECQFCIFTHAEDDLDSRGKYLLTVIEPNNFKTMSASRVRRSVVFLFFKKRKEL